MVDLEIEAAPLVSNIELNIELECVMVVNVVILGK